MKRNRGEPCAKEGFESELCDLPRGHDGACRMVKGCAHTPCPETYVSWSRWAAKMSKTHNTYMCPHCRMWTVWHPKEAKP